jgi:hypothetical protein
VVGHVRRNGMSILLDSRKVKESRSQSLIAKAKKLRPSLTHWLLENYPLYRFLSSGLPRPLAASSLRPKLLTHRAARFLLAAESRISSSAGHPWSFRREWLASGSPVTFPELPSSISR